MRIEERKWIEKFYEREKSSLDEKMSEENKEVSDFLRREFSSYTDSLNKQYGKDAIGILALPPDFMNAVLDIETQNPGVFLLFGKQKLVMVLFGEKREIVFVGRKIHPDSPKTQKNLKLLQVRWEIKEDTRYVFRDTSGIQVELSELISRIIRWGTD